jgi:hypothetical protein
MKSITRAIRLVSIRFVLGFLRLRCSSRVWFVNTASLGKKTILIQPWVKPLIYENGCPEPPWQFLIGFFVSGSLWPNPLIYPPAHGRYLFPACSGRLLGLDAMEEPNSFFVSGSLFSVRKRRYHVINLVGNRYEAFM